MNSYYLKDVLEIKNGRDHKGLKDGEIPVFGSGGVMRYVNQSIYDDESILLPRKGTLSNIQYCSKPFWTVDTLYYTIVDKSKASPYYLYHYLKRLDLTNLNSGTGVPSMTFGAYYGIKLQLPDLSSQQKIASVLSALDNKIEMNNKINAELEEMAKTLYNYWFVQFDFPDANGKPYKSSGGKMVWNEALKREVPEGWDVDTLQGLIDFTRGVSYTSATVNEEFGAPMINLKSFNLNGTYRIDGLKYFTGKLSTSRLIFENDLLIAITDVTREAEIIGKAIKTPSFENDMVCSCDVARVNILDKKITPNYLRYLFNSKSYHDYIKHFASGTLVLHLDLNGVLWFKSVIPSMETLIKFESFVNDIDRKIANNIKQNQELAQFRDWLLPMLMNNQINIKSKNYEYTK